MTTNSQEVLPTSLMEPTSSEAEKEKELKEKLLRRKSGGKANETTPPNSDGTNSNNDSEKDFGDKYCSNDQKNHVTPFDKDQDKVENQNQNASSLSASSSPRHSDKDMVRRDSGSISSSASARSDGKKNDRGRIQHRGHARNHGSGSRPHRGLHGPSRGSGGYGGHGYDDRGHPPRRRHHPPHSGSGRFDRGGFPPPHPHHGHGPGRRFSGPPPPYRGGPPPHPHNGRDHGFNGPHHPPPPPPHHHNHPHTPPPMMMSNNDYWDPRSFTPSSDSSSASGGSRSGGSWSGRSRTPSRSPSPARGRSRDRRSRSRSRSRSASSSGSSSVDSLSSRSSRSSSESSNDSRGSISSRSRSPSPHDEDGDDHVKHSRSPSPAGSKSSRRSHGSGDDGDGNEKDRGKESRSASSRKRKKGGDRGYSSGSDQSASDVSMDSTSGRRSRRRSRGRSSRKKRRSGSTPKKDTKFTKDQRTVFVSQLVMRATERDIKRYFKRMVGCKVNDVILLRDRRSRNHKGCAYVELARIEDVAVATAVSGEPPDFQRFPILVKASEAEKNYVAPSPSLKKASEIMSPSKSSLAYSDLPPLTDADGKTLEAKVYVGGLDPNVTQQHIFALCSQIGPVYRVQMMVDPVTNLNKGYAFVTYRDPKDGFLAIQALNGSILTQRALKSNWANKPNANTSGVVTVTCSELPEDAAEKVQKAMVVLGQLNGTPPPPSPILPAASAASHTPAVLTAVTAASSSFPQTTQSTDATQVAQSSPAINVEQKIQKAASIAASIAQTVNATPATSPAIGTVAEARASMAAAIAKSNLNTATAVPASETISFNPLPAGSPSCHLLVHNMFNKDEETEPGWQNEIKDDFVDECSKFGKIKDVTVMYQEPGGKILASFDTLEGAQACAKNLHGRWFDKRQLRVAFVQDSNLPVTAL